jgi:N-acetylglutamate synthase-like GNAT family acetyltransferase
VRLFRAVEKELRRRGVQRWFAGSKVHADASALFERLDFKRVEVYYSKWIGD